jgi:hypothetical protein
VGLQRRRVGQHRFWITSGRDGLADPTHQRHQLGDGVLRRHGVIHDRGVQRPPGPWSNVPSPGSSPTATDASASAAPTATAWLDHRVAAINLRQLIRRGLTSTNGTWAIAREDVRSLVLFAVALGLHFVVNDYGLRQHHGSAYERYGRWVCATGVVTGWAVGATTEVAESHLGLVIAFLAGGVVLNVLKEELPEERESSLSAFLLGASGYAALLLLL